MENAWRVRSLEVMGSMQGLVTKDNHQPAHHKQPREVIVGSEVRGERRWGPGPGLGGAC